MKGGIYTDEKCSICGNTLKDDRTKALRCPNHPTQIALKFRVHFDRVKRRFDSYTEAHRFLTGLRYKTDENTFDARDYSNKKPLSFSSLASNWLDYKRETVKSTSYCNLHSYMMKAIDAWGETSIKNIKFAEIEDFLLAQSRQFSSKTVSNMRSCLHDFFSWLVRREIISKVPNFPEIKVKLAFRKIIGKESQTALLDKIKEIAPFRVWLGIKWLCTYVSIRPGELIQIREEDINLENRYIFIHHSKTGDTKPVPMLDEDVALVKKLQASFPKSFFFRHDEQKSGIKLGQPYGKKYFYKWWVKACEDLGIEGVDLYGGTRHSSVVALREHFSPEEIKHGTMHQTNKAFERYFRIGAEDVRNIYSHTVIGGKEMGKKIAELNKRKS